MIKRSLAFIMLLTAGTFVPAVTASAQSAPPAGTIGIRLLDAPVARQDDPRAREFIVDHLSQGTTISRRFEVINNTVDTQTLELYPGAAKIADGAFTALEGHAANDLTSWTTVSPSSVTLAPGQASQSTVTIAIPQGVSDGERYGAVWASRVATTQAGVNVENRVGIRMYLSIGTGAEPTSDFVIETLQAARDEKTHQPLVNAMVRNTGGRALDMSGKLELKDGPGGLNAGPFPAKLGTTLGIGQREPVTVPLDKQIPKGPWNAVITLASGEIVHSAQARITFPDSGAAKPVKAEGLAGKLKIFLPLLAIVLALIVGLIIILKRRRKDKDDYAQVKADLKRFEEMVKAQEGGAVIPAKTVDDPLVAIRAAIKQARRAGDEKTAAKLESRLEALLERQAAIPVLAKDDLLPSHKNTKVRPSEQLAGPREQETAPPPPPTVPAPAPPSPAPATAGSSPQPASVAAVAPESTNGHSNGNGHTNGSVTQTGSGHTNGSVTQTGSGHTREADASLVAILKMLATTPPGGQRFALVKAARQYGREAIEAHADELAVLPDDVRIRLLRAAPQQPEPSEIA